MGLARSSSFAVGERSGVVGADLDLEEGMAIRTEVRVVESGIEALRRARREVCRRWGRSDSDCFMLATALAYTKVTK
jgi:hypothetical protein